MLAAIRAGYPEPPTSNVLSRSGFSNASIHTQPNDLCLYLSAVKRRVEWMNGKMNAVCEIKSSNWLFSGHFTLLSRQKCIWLDEHTNRQTDTEIYIYISMENNVLSELHVAQRKQYTAQHMYNHTR